jgi:predicted acyltransferase
MTGSAGFGARVLQLMILVDGAGGEWPVIGHAPWNGCNLADFAMPFFLFIVGMAIPLSLKVRSSSFSQRVYSCTPSPIIFFLSVLSVTTSQNCSEKC